jgi:hypothetical protein
MSDQPQQAEEQRLSLAADFQETFSTPSGQRVLHYILNNLLLDKSQSVFPTQQGMYYPNADRAMYLLALSDVSKTIKNIMEYDFTSRQKRPVVHTRRPRTMSDYINSRGSDE